MGWRVRFRFFFVSPLALLLLIHGRCFSQWEGCGLTGAWKKDYELKKHLNDRHHHHVRKCSFENRELTLNLPSSCPQGYDCEWKGCTFSCCFSSQVCPHFLCFSDFPLPDFSCCRCCFTSSWLIWKTTTLERGSSSTNARYSFDNKDPFVLRKSQGSLSLLFVYFSGKIATTRPRTRSAPSL